MSSHNPTDAYSTKQLGYFDVDRHDLVQLVPDNTGRVLDIGAAEGSTLVALKRAGKAREVVGIELNAIAGGGQARSEIDRFIIANIEEEALDLQLQSFDVIICGDVLEHLRDPWRAVKYLVGFLRPGGTFIISLPNIQYWRAFGRIALGDFRYAPAGVLDQTHLRFFCRKNMIALATSAKLEVNVVEPSFRRHRLLRKDRVMNALTLGLFERFFAQQYLLVATTSRSGD